MIRKTIFAAATLAAIGAAALIPTQAFAGGGGKVVAWAAAITATAAMAIGEAGSAALC